MRDFLSLSLTASTKLQRTNRRALTSHWKCSTPSSLLIFDFTERVFWITLGCVCARRNIVLAEKKKKKQWAITFQSDANKEAIWEHNGETEIKACFMSGNEISNFSGMCTVVQKVSRTKLQWRVWGRERENNVCFVPYLFFLLPLSRLAGTFSPHKAKKILSSAYLSLRRHNRKPITFVLVAQILINAVYKRDPIAQRYLHVGDAGRRRNASGWQGAISLRRSCAPRTAWHCSSGSGCFCSTSLISQMSLAEAGLRSCIFRLIYDLCRGGGALGRSATSTYRHTATTGRKKRRRAAEEGPCDVLANARVQLCMCVRLQLLRRCKSQSGAEPSQLLDACVSVCVVIPGDFSDTTAPVHLPFFLHPPPLPLFTRELAWSDNSTTGSREN